MQRALGTGLIGGLIITLAGLYPLIRLLAPRWLVGWQRPFPPHIHLIWLIGSAVLALPALLGLGFWAARRARAIGWWQGARRGAQAGLVASWLVYLGLFLPGRVLVGYGRLPTTIPESSPDLLNATASFLRGFTRPMGDWPVHPELILPLLLLFWVGSGAVVGWRRRGEVVAERPSLLDLFQAGEPLKKWFAGDEAALRLGLRAGLVLALVAVAGALFWLLAALVQNWPELAVLVLPAAWQPFTAQLARLSPLLWPILLFALVNLGFVVVLLPKNPVDRWRARATAVWLATFVVVTTLVMLLLHLAYLLWGTAVLLTNHWLAANDNLTAETVSLLQRQQALLADSGSQLAILLAAPWLAWLLALLLAIVLGGWQALLVVPVFSVRTRPVDRAAQLRRRVRQQSEEPLPLLYRLFDQTPQAYDVLAHLARHTERSQPAVAQLAAALHTLGYSQEVVQDERAVTAVAILLTEQRGWRWAADLGPFYQMLQAVLPVQTLAEVDLLTLPPPPNSTALPTLVVQNGRHLSRIVHQLQKVNQAGDLATRRIFLENSATAVGEAMTAVQAALAQLLPVPLPHLPALERLLRRWQQLIQAESARVTAQAELVLTLSTPHAEFAEELPLVWQVHNHGLSPAYSVRVQLLPGEGYYLLGVKSEAQLAELPPGAAQPVAMIIMPEAGRQELVLAVELRFTDGVAADQRRQFDHQLNIARQERPFLPIQPNPYLPGTPLKPGDFFAGRGELLRFVQDTLAHANRSSLIVLQGIARSGKTSLLNQLPGALAATHWAVHLDLQGHPAQNEADFLYALADEIVFVLSQQGIGAALPLQAALPPRAEFAESPEFFFRARFLRQLLPQLGDKKLLLLVDDAERLAQWVVDGRLPADILRFLHTLRQHESQIDFVFAGWGLAETAVDEWATLLDNAVYRSLMPLTQLEMHQLITGPVAPYHVAYDPPALDRLVHLAAGHPYLAQLLLHELVQVHNEMHVTYLTVVDVDQVVQRLLQRGDMHFRYLWAESGEAEQLVLRAVAELSRSAAPVTIKALRQFLGERGHVSPDRWQSALARLESRTLLVSQQPMGPAGQSDNTLHYHFRAELIRLWLEQMPPLPEV
ncbi:MAG: ATP-binding protein [Anaerolineae bacterium]|nr:ATP-binding protein [Anaerolineae bacterium]